MEVHDLQHISLALYQYMCQHIVGSAEAVKTKRLLMAIGDSMSSGRYSSGITSGSFGEGLELKGSDFDYMLLRKDLQVYENVLEIKWNPSETYFIVDTEDTKPGFVRLQFLYSPAEAVINLCLDSKGVLYLSNRLIKLEFKSSMRQNTATDYSTDVTHGPCLSDKDGFFDLAVCMKLNTWIKQANHWMTRSHLSWPCNEVKSKIIEHGVLFVPVGVKGSPNEEIEWRLSFSVAEKLLINSFAHTQFLCYALMKIILKDVINTDKSCKDLLCSYFIKNIMFWVSEELSFSCWEPHYLLFCFMQCFGRLIYCVEYSLCPHYFIHENNMFENRIEGYNRKVLLDKLKALYALDWKLILFSPQLQDFLQIPSIKYTESQLFVNYVEHMNLSSVLDSTIHWSENCYSNSIKIFQTFRSSEINSYYLFNLSEVCREKADTVEFTEINNNRKTYKNYKLCQSYLLQNLHYDAVTRWLYVASLFYKIKQYRKALDILHYALSNCSQEQFLRKTKLSKAQRDILNSKTLQNKGLIRIFKFILLEPVGFGMKSTLIPKELDLEAANSYHYIPPVVYAHFLHCLCHFHLGNERQLRNSLDDLKLTISEDYFISSKPLKSSSYNCLGISLQLVRENDSAQQAFHNAFQLDPLGWYSCAKKRLQMANDE